MAVFNTSNCTITVGGTALPNVIDATVSLSMETIDVSEIGSLDRAYVPGIRTGTISGTIFYDQGDSSISAIEAAVKSGTAVTFVFTWHSAATYTASAIITSFSPSIAIADVVRASFEAQITGAVTISA